MLITALDGNGIAQQVIVSSQEALVDHSSSIVTTGTPQELLPVNLLRSGFIMQNRGGNRMYIDDIETVVLATNEQGLTVGGPGSFMIEPGEYWPPSDYPVTTNAISILGTAGDQFTVKEW